MPPERPKARPHDGFYEKRIRYTTLQTQHMLFRIKSSWLSKRSPVFDRILKEAEHDDDSNPLWLEGVKADTFHNILKWVDKQSGASPAYRSLRHIKFTSEELEEMFEFSCKWDMEALRTYCRDELHTRAWNTSKKIQFAIKHNLGLPWACSAFKDLASSGPMFPASEAVSMVPQVLFVVMYIRDKEMERRRLNCQCHTRVYRLTGRYEAKKCNCARRSPSDRDLLEWIQEAEEEWGEAKRLATVECPSNSP